MVQFYHSRPNPSAYMMKDITTTCFILVASSAWALDPASPQPGLRNPPKKPRIESADTILTIHEESRQLKESRKEQIDRVRKGVQYGPDIIPGLGGAPYPTGDLAKEIVNGMYADFNSEQVPWAERCQAEAADAGGYIMSTGGIKTFEDYKKLYDGTFQNTIPGGPSKGILSNATSDLLFAMERLSSQPYSLRRIGKTEELSFSISDGDAKKLSTMTIKDLQSKGHLFYVDYREQKDQKLTQGRYAGACDAYFFIHPESEDFLPLAIRPNNGSPLLYTPLDEKNDWILAKMLFNMNDFWWGQWYHLAATHEVIDLVSTAAIRTLSVMHPINALLKRLAYQTYAIRMSAIHSLIQKGGPVDDYWAWSADVAGSSTSKLYGSTAGAWKSNYFRPRLTNKGLYRSDFGPPLKHFPFYEDASVIYDAIEKVMVEVTDSFYPDAEALKQDDELQNFIKEMNGPAKVIDLGLEDMSDTRDLIDFLSHFAYLVSIKHGTLNSNEPSHTTAALPMHPAALYLPLPKEKGVKDLMPFMPKLEAAIGQIGVLAAFNRPFFAKEKKTLLYMFTDETFLAWSNDRIRKAADEFQQSMKSFSAKVSARKFDDQGLSQGMPFVWKVLDPETTPFYLTI